MESLDFMLYSVPDDDEKKNLEKLNELLSKLNASAEFRKVKDYCFLRIAYDTNDVQKICSRGAGRPKKYLNSISTVEEVRERMKNETAEDIAESLGISRSTFFRKLKEIEKNGGEYFI